MTDLIPLQYYFDVYIHLSLFIVGGIILHSFLLRISDIKNVLFLNITGIFIFIFSIFYIGLRPISGYYFVDMITYANFFKSYANGGEIIARQDLFFHVFMKFCSQIMTVKVFFLLCTILYISPMLIISKKLFGRYWFYSFFMLVVSFSFWAYAVNGIRNGIATSIFLLALAYYERRVVFFILLMVSCSFHKTLILPCFAFIITLINNNPKTYIKYWILAIPLSLFLGGVWISFFSSFGFADERLSGYLNGQKDAAIASLGFRWDFLIYSSSAVILGWYFIFKRGFKDNFYYTIYNIYLISNSFWILVIRANFSNRFAYISWFLMGVIIIYPLLKKNFFENQNSIIGKIVLCYFSFTYIMYLIYL